MKDVSAQPPITCAACGKPSAEVKKIVMFRPHSGLCNECIDLFYEIVHTEDLPTRYTTYDE